MKFSVDSTELKLALATVAHTVDRRKVTGSGAIYLNVKKDNYLRLFTTDGTAKTVIKIPADVDQAGEAVVDYALLATLASCAGEGIRLTAELSTSKSNQKQSLVVAVSKVKSRLAISPGLTADLKSWLSHIPFTQAPSFVIDHGKLSSLVDATADFVWAGDSGEMFKKLKISQMKGKWRAEASNQEVIAIADVEQEDLEPGTESIFIPVQALGQLQKMLRNTKSGPVEIILTRVPNGDEPNSVYFKTSDTFYGASLTGRHTVDFVKMYEKVKVKKTLIMDRLNLRQCLQRCDRFTQAGNQLGEAGLVKLACAFTTLKLRGSTGGENDEFEEEIAGEAVEGAAADGGEILRMKIKASQFEGILGSATEDKIQLGIVSEAKAARITVTSRSGDTHVRYLLGGLPESVATQSTLAA